MKKKLLAMILVFVFALSLAACQANDDAGKGNDAPANTTETKEPADTTKEPAEEAPAEKPTEEEPAAPSTDPETMLLEGRYLYSYVAEGHGEYGYFFHFYEEDPVLGPIFYAGFTNNKMPFVGTYALEKTPFDYACYPDRAAKTADDVEPTTGTAPYTITFFDWDGNELGKVGYDGDNLYNMMLSGSAIYANGSDEVIYYHDIENTKPTLYEGEVGVPVWEYVADNEATSTLAICHNKTYVDLVDYMIEGTWEVSENANGGLDFALTPDDSTESPVVVSTSADALTCTYTPEGGEALAMSAPTEAKLVYTFKGNTVIPANNMEAEVILELFDDNTCTAYASLGGNRLDLTTGTYALEGYTFNFDFDSAEDVASTLVEKLPTVQLTVAGTKIGDVDSALSMVK